MCEPALDADKRTVTIPKALIYSRKNPSQTGDRGAGDMEFPRVLKNAEIPGIN